jgi:hypothetical protein
MTQFELGLLARILSLEGEFRVRGEPQWARPGGRAGLREAGERINWEWRRDHGPRIAELHGNGYPENDAFRKRVSRALERLELAGLVERWRAWEGKGGLYFTHVKVTAKGVDVLAERMGGGK